MPHILGKFRNATSFASVRFPSPPLPLPFLFPSSNFFISLTFSSSLSPLYHIPLFPSLLFSLIFPSPPLFHPFLSPSSPILPIPSTTLPIFPSSSLSLLFPLPLFPSFHFSLSLLFPSSPPFLIFRYSKFIRCFILFPLQFIQGVLGAGSQRLLCSLGNCNDFENLSEKYKKQYIKNKHYSLISFTRIQ